MFGGGLAFFVEYFDNTIKTPEEAERYLGLPTLGMIPLYEPQTK
jgi:capsular polysaccharide biosynthesis protein